MAEKTPIPAAAKNDSEDVSWALSTAEAMWSRGDRSDAIKWIRKAVEAASEAQDDDRALELAKAAADLASQVGVVQTAPPPPVAAKPSVPPRPAPARSAPPPPPAASRPPPPPTSSRPASPAASQPAPSQPAPPAAKPAAPKPAAPLTSPAAPKAPAQPRVVGTAQPRPHTTAAGAKAPIPPARPAAGTPAKPGARSRKSQANLEEQAKRAAELAAQGDPTIIQPSIVQPAPPDEVTQEIRIPEGSKRRARASKPSPEEVTGEVVHAPVAATTDEMDSWPTQSITGVSFNENDELTRIGEPAYQATAQASAADSTPEPARADPALRHSQAVRVVVWRGPDGVRVAPYGTTVNAIGVDALLVALDPNADLATWLSRK